MEYRCEECSQPCQPKMYECGIGAGCHLEAYLLVEDDGLWRHLTASEETDLREAWFAEQDFSAGERARMRVMGNS
jgi:hypothetical protein